ncbi:MAG: hypothetical protein WKF91_10385 [Segetibacter sp.]
MRYESITYSPYSIRMFYNSSAQNNSLGIVRGTPVDAIHKKLMPEG